MTAAQFRRAARALPEVEERAHMGHPDFRVRGKIFATLGAPDRAWGVVKLSPWHQQALLESGGDAYEPAAGAWGRQGYTQIRLSKAAIGIVTQALLVAWQLTAPKTLVRAHRDAE